MMAADTAQTVDWLAACRRAVTGLQRLLEQASEPAQRVAETGTRGAGGDRTLVLDRRAEEIVFAELDALHAGGLQFTAISEERGEQRFGGAHAGSWRVVVDPIDGSLNAKRDGAHYALSVAVADGPTMADVTFGFVHDFGAREQWWASRGEGAWRSTASARPGAATDPASVTRLAPELGDRRSRDGTLEIVYVESADPRWVRGCVDELVDVAHRLRALGSIAVSLCQVAAARGDGLVTLRRARGVDSAAGQLIVREAGGLVAFPDCPEPLGAPLDVTASSRVVAARSSEGLRDLERVAGAMQGAGT